MCLGAKTYLPVLWGVRTLYSTLQLSMSDRTDTFYGYVPTLGVCATFIALFSVTLLIHIVQATYYRLWWLYPTVCLAGLGEIIGWAGRLWSNRNIDNLNPFLMQITTTIIAPTPLVAANFVVLGLVIREFGSQYSRLSPGWYTFVFCAADIVALIVQAIGGASASQAAQNNEDASTGGNIMLGGIVFQLVAITFYVALAAEFLIRFFAKKPVRIVTPGTSSPAVVFDKRAQLVVLGLAISTLFIFIRAIYRTIELSDGWEGRIITTELYFNVLDGGMIALAMFTLNFLHPGLRFRGVSSPLKADRGKSKSAEFVESQPEEVESTEKVSKQRY